MAVMVGVVFIVEFDEDDRRRAKFGRQRFKLESVICSLTRFLLVDLT